MVEIKVPEVHRKWEDGPIAKFSLEAKGRVDFTLPQKTQLANAKISGRVKPQSLDIEDFPDWVEKKLINPKLKPNSFEKKILDLLSPRELKRFQNIWVESSNLSTQGEDVVLSVSGNVVLTK